MPPALCGQWTCNVFGIYPTCYAGFYLIPYTAQAGLYFFYAYFTKIQIFCNKFYEKP